MILCLGAKVVCAWNEPAGFRDIPWGASVEQAAKLLPGLRCISNPPGVCEHTDVKMPVGDVPNVYVEIWFGKSGMDSVKLNFSPSEFSEIKEAFIKRYGTPTSHIAVAAAETDTFSLGRIPDPMHPAHETLSWEGARVVIILEEMTPKWYGPDTLNGPATIRTRARYTTDVAPPAKHIKRSSEGDL